MRIHADASSSSGIIIIILPLLLLLTATLVSANDNGLALTPPMGWRSWNLYEGSVDQTKMTAALHGMVRRHSRPDHTGAVVSLADLGYQSVGLDDLWQDCHSTEAAEGMQYHDDQGRPLVHHQRFPSLSEMTGLAHALNLTASWYANNCACSDHCRTTEECEKQIRGDVQALFQYGFDGLKIDGCGNETNLVTWNRFMDDYSRSHSEFLHHKIVVENCHGPDPRFKPNRTLPPSVGCPYHFYRTSHDIRNNYGSIMSNLGTLKAFHARNESYPGCWAYPDMLMVGVGENTNGGGDGGGGGSGDHTNDATLTTTTMVEGLNMAETRSHFAAWAICSSPLTLSHDVNNENVTDRIWDIISNREILAINQAYAGDSGGVYQESEELVRIRGGRQWYHIPSYQYLSKPMRGIGTGIGIGIGIGRDQTNIAVLLMNSGNSTRHMTAIFQDIPNSACALQATTTTTTTATTRSQPSPSGACAYKYHVRDIWAHQPLGIFYDTWSVDVAPHDAAFIMLEPVQVDISSITADR